MQCASIDCSYTQAENLTSYSAAHSENRKAQIAFGIAHFLFCFISWTVFCVFFSNDGQYTFFCDLTFFFYILLSLVASSFFFFFYIYLFIFVSTLTWQDTISYFIQWIYVVAILNCNSSCTVCKSDCLSICNLLASFPRANDKEIKRQKQKRCPRLAMPLWNITSKVISMALPFVQTKNWVCSRNCVK